MFHTDWELDLYKPDHTPHRRQLVWRDGTLDEAGEIMRRRIESHELEPDYFLGGLLEAPVLHIDRNLLSLASHRDRPGADPLPGSVRPVAGLRHQPHALLEGTSDPREGGRDAGLDRQQHHRLVPSAVSAWVLLPGAGRDQRTGPAHRVEGHGRHPARPDSAAGCQLAAAQPADVTAPRTPWGHPDIQGVWDYRTLTTLERPEELGDKALMTEEEAASLEQETVARNELLFAVTLNSFA